MLQQLRHAGFGKPTHPPGTVTQSSFFAWWWMLPSAACFVDFAASLCLAVVSTTPALNAGCIIFQ
jgi:hypothetical protein